MAQLPGGTVTVPDELASAVEAWSAVYGAAAVRGELGGGRDGSTIVV